MHGQSSGLPMQREFFFEVFAVKQEERISIEASSSPLIAQWKVLSLVKNGIKMNQEIVPILQRILHGAADVAEVLGQAQSIEGCLMKLKLTDSEAALLGWRPELLGD